MQYAPIDVSLNTKDGVCSCEHVTIKSLMLLVNQVWWQVNFQ